MSGGRATIGLAKGIKRGAQAGDVSAIDPAGALLIKTYLIECKHLKSLKLAQVVTYAAVKGGLIDIWHRVSADAVKHRKRPMLIAKQNHLPTVVCFRDDERHRHSPVSLLDDVGVTVRLDSSAIFIMPFDRFLAEATFYEGFDHFRHASQRRRPRRISLRHLQVADSTGD